jgi:cytoskeletal protein CcmA (bactofilin family)
MEEPKTVLAEDVEITGNIKCAGGIRMAGKLTGDLACAGDVLVEKTSTIKGNLTTNSVVVLGVVRGNVTAKDRIELKANARVAGDLKAKRLIVEDGVSFVGKSEINASRDLAGEGGAELEPEPAAEPAEEPARGESDDAARATTAARPSAVSGDSRVRSTPLFTRK